MENTETDRRKARDLLTRSWRPIFLSALSVIGIISISAVCLLSMQITWWQTAILVVCSIGASAYTSEAVALRRSARRILGMQWSGVQPVDPIPPPSPPKPRPKDR